MLISEAQLLGLVVRACLLGFIAGSIVVACALCFFADAVMYLFSCCADEGQEGDAEPGDESGEGE